MHRFVSVMCVLGVAYPDFVDIIGVVGEEKLGLISNGNKLSKELNSERTLYLL